MPESVGAHLASSPASANAATPWTGAPVGTWTGSSAARARIGSGTTQPRSTVGELAAGAGTGLVLISMLLTWYRVTITSAGFQYLESLERALFPQAAAGLGGVTGPLSTSVSALGQGAGGWRWTILVVSIVLLLVLLLATTSGMARKSSSSGPSAAVAVILVLATTNLVLVAVAFFNLPFGGTPAAYMTVTRGVGAYLGLLAGIVALGGAVAPLFRSSPDAGLR